MYIVLIYSRGLKTWQTFNYKEQALDYAKSYNHPNDKVYVYEVDNTKPIFNS